MKIEKEGREGWGKMEEVEENIFFLDSGIVSIYNYVPWGKGSS